MNWWLHRVGEVVVRIVLPVSMIPSGVFLWAYGIRLSSEEGGSWLASLPGAGLTLGAIVLLVLMNTRRARRRWVPYEIPDEHEQAKH